MEHQSTRNSVPKRSVIALPLPINNKPNRRPTSATRPEDPRPLHPANCRSGLLNGQVSLHGRGRCTRTAGNTQVECVTRRPYTRSAVPGTTGGTPASAWPDPKSPVTLGGEFSR